jgi:hypothetical protein
MDEGKGRGVQWACSSQLFGTPRYSILLLIIDRGAVPSRLLASPSLSARPNVSNGFDGLASPFLRLPFAVLLLGINQLGNTPETAAPVSCKVLALAC